jgi:C-terminal processing protease CtpA/Prc
MTPGEGNNLCGVGINLKPDVTGALEVHSVVPGSPAAADTQIKQGDVLVQVNDPTVTAVPEPTPCSAETVAAGPTAACRVTRAC